MGVSSVLKLLTNLLNSVGSSHFLAVRREKPHTQFDPKKSECVILGFPQNVRRTQDRSTQMGVGRGF